MKLFFLVGLFLSQLSFGAYINQAAYDESTNELVLGVTYGGCGSDTFVPVYGPCRETYPAQLTITIDDSRDLCKAVMQTTLRYSLEELTCRPAYASINTKRNPKLFKSVFIPK